MADITITLPDGSQRSLAQGATATTVAESIGSRLAKAAVAATVNGDEWDLGRELPDGAAVGIITGDSEEGRHVLRHSTAHVMAQAVTQLFPGAKFSIGPAIENGFYYDFELPGGQTFSDDDLVAIEARMNDIIKAEPAVRARRAVAERRPEVVRRSALQVRDHRARARRAPPIARTPARSAVARPSASIATPTSSSTCAAGRTSLRRASSATSS